MPRYTKIPCAVLALTLMLGAMASSCDEQDLQAVSRTNTAFGLDLYQQLRDTDGNLFFSPYSISTALAMTWAGARGQTEQEMREVLYFPDNQPQLHAAMQALQSHLAAVQDKGDCSLSVANSLWCQEDFKLLESFQDLNRRYYGAGVRLVDFRTKTEEVRQQINAWVEQETRQKIKDLIKPGILTSNTPLVLCNAIYFKGNWASQFEKRMTRDANFHLDPQQVVSVRMMSQARKFRLLQLENFSALEMPYNGDDLSMVILLPSDIAGLPALEDGLTASRMAALLQELSQVQPTRTRVELPKFKMTCEFELNKVLAKMGMPSAFNGADFSGMTGKRELFIGNVIHKAFVAVDEEGTEAAAATAVVMKRASMPMPLEFRADHPFLFLIKDNTTGSVLFMGRVADPRS